MDLTAKRALALLAIAAALPLFGCTSLADIATQRCRGFPAGTLAYQACWQRQYQEQMRLMDERNRRRIELEQRARP